MANPVPTNWTEEYYYGISAPDLQSQFASVDEYLASIRQPDGSLPTYGTPVTKEDIGRGDQVVQSWQDYYNYLPPRTLQEFPTFEAWAQSKWPDGNIPEFTPGVTVQLGGSGGVAITQSPDSPAWRPTDVSPGGGTPTSMPRLGSGGSAFDMDFQFGAPEIPDMLGTLSDLHQGRRALVSTEIDLLQRYGPRGIQKVKEGIPELGAASRAAQGAFGADFGATFKSALQEAAEARGVDPSQIAEFDAELASESVQEQATGLAFKTGFEDLMFAGFVPPQNLDFGTLGSLSIQQAKFQSELQAGINQSLQAQSMFSMMLPGLLGTNDPLKL
jgi:hypothetical protein